MPGAASIVVLDAHDEGLVQGQAPTWDAPSVAAERARLAAIPCLWVTPCPTVELLAAAKRVHVASASAERSGWAALDVVDCRREDPRAGLYSAGLVSVLRSDYRVVCVLNRKGRAQLSACDACGELAACEQCGAAVAVVGEGMVCRRCGTSRPMVCASCGSSVLRLLRVGVSRAREQLEALAGRPVGEVSAGSGPLPATPVVVGTEAVLYREGELRRGGGVGAVAFLDFDQELLAPRYRAGEEALALLARASRLVGGRQRDGKVLVQTRVPGHPVIEAALLADPGRLAASEEAVRKALRLPRSPLWQCCPARVPASWPTALEKLDVAKVTRRGANSGGAGRAERGGRGPLGRASLRPCQPRGRSSSCRPAQRAGSDRHRPGPFLVPVQSDRSAAAMWVGLTTAALRLRLRLAPERIRTRQSQSGSRAGRAARSRPSPCGMP